jgi:hypothetical protein
VIRLKNGNAYILIFARALKWILFSPQRKKLQKVWGIYKIGGIGLCWHCMKERFEARLLRYDPFQNQLSAVQSRYVLENCPIKPLLSIVVPVHKVACEWLEKCIGSVANQHYKNWELILVDDASQRDDLRRLIDQCVSRDNRICSC